jgi:transcription elongation GreA/GreB family factor
VKYLAAFLFTSCATTGDLREVADAVTRISAVVQEQEGLTEGARVEAEAAGKQAQAAAEAAENRNESLLGALLSPNGAVAGVLTLGSTVGLHLYRNRTRRRVLRSKELLT